jgi:YD repeat-containing protein
VLFLLTVFTANKPHFKNRRRVYYALNRLTQDIGAYNQTSQYQYDNLYRLIRRAVGWTGGASSAI